ncbi:hypothetical protein CC86DRAFT_382936 [Ophiobolus disseminans]|uniref:Uncharacterized protein n=1 Tax=Ophiobolus disseminans TaxID=1469910 RepID=A0A6A6ZY39_9PLEO|nr:hypothetical protein CC86DRAFT_382936 [Ophiobolus disseminans]
MSNNKHVTLVTSEAQNHISRELRNNIYSALLSGDGIRNIESILDRQLAESGFKDELRRYVTELFRSGQAATVDEAKVLAMDRIRQQMADDQTNGTNGANGTNGNHVDDSNLYDLKIPHKAIVEGTKSVRRELEKVCDITED